MTYFILGWLTGLTAYQVYLARKLRAATPEGAITASVGKGWRLPTQHAEFITGNRVEEIIKGSKGAVSLSDVLV